MLNWKYSQVLKIDKYNKGKVELETVAVEEHIECKCKCIKKEEHCLPPEYQYYDNNTCSCKCLNENARIECLAVSKNESMQSNFN